MDEGFIQAPPELGNQYLEDRLPRSLLRRVMGAEALAEIEPSLERMGELAGGELYKLQLEDRLNEPRLERWDAWGRRIDRVEPTALWRRAEELAAREGLVALAYERRHDGLSRLHQFSLVYLFTPSTDIYSCPLAMTDAAAKTLEVSGNRRLIERAMPHLTSRDPATFWTSGQWMTEAAGGSDVADTSTVARKDAEGRWRLYGRKWFTSAVASQMAMTLARPEGNGPGSKNLALFYLETRNGDGSPRQLSIDRLKDKLGTRKVPTAELTLEGTPAELVLGTTDGVRNIAPMLNVTRLWNGVSAAALMRRGIALARDYASRRVAFGAPLSEQPLHLDLLAGLQAELEGVFHLVFFVAELLGKEECGELDERRGKLLRALIPVMKLTTARQAVAVASEVLEAFGGAGYVEDTGLPVLLRDSQVLPIWEGTTNVLALDTLRALREPGSWEAIRLEARQTAEEVTDEGLAAAARAARQALDGAGGWLEQATAAGRAATEAGARRFALTAGRAFELLLLARHAQWSLENESDPRPAAAARRLARSGIDQITPHDPADARTLAHDEAP